MEKERLRAKRSVCRFSFRLRTLLLVTLAVAAALGWMTNRAPRRDKAVHLLQGYYYVEVHFDWSSYYWMPVPLRVAMAPWIMQCPLVNFANTCDPYWHLHDDDVSSNQKQEIVSAILSLTELEHLTITFGMRDEDLAMLSGLSELRILLFQARGVTDQGIRHLEKLEKLEALNILGSSDSTCRISPEAIMRLNRLPKLRFVETMAIRLSAEEAARIRAAFPSAKVELRALPN
jgi:hypothetical protein